MKIVISSGHAKHCRGASDIIDEVDEARKVVDRVFNLLGGSGVAKFHDDMSDDQSENLNRIVNFHNSKLRDLDVSVHFNAYEHTNNPMGTECLYVTQLELATKVASGISESGFKNRGPKKRDDLFFLNNTEQPAILIEVCFVDSQADVNIYKAKFDKICTSICEALIGVVTGSEPKPPSAIFNVRGKVSYFGGPDDEGVSPTEGLAFITSVEQAPQLFLPFQPADTSGLARRLNPYVHYVACRWDYNKTPKSMLTEHFALVSAPSTGIALKAFPADWGPHEDTGRVADVSPGLMDDLGIKTDDQVEVTFPVTIS